MIKRYNILFVLLVTLICLLQHTNAYLPGMFPQEFRKDEDISVKVNKITSVHTQLPYKYYKLPVCQPKSIKDEGENLGEILLGDRIENSLFKFKFLQNEECVVVNGLDDANDCKPELQKKDIQQLIEYVKQEYKVHWLLDGLPVRQSNALNRHEPGFQLGYVNKGGDEGTYLYNHLNITIEYHEYAQDIYRVVGFIVEPLSIAYPVGSDWKKTTTCPPANSLPALELSEQSRSILWTYSVNFQSSDTLWNKRWETFLKTDDQSVRFHWFSILNSLMIVFFLTVMVALIMMRTLKADFRKYNSIDTTDEPEETGWKMIHGDVFRPPTRPMFLSVLVGSGVQIFSMAVVTMFFAVLGFLSPANIGGLATALIVLFIIMAMFAGYFSTRAFVIFKGNNWKKNTIYTAFAFPGTIFFIFFFINMFLRGAGSSAAVPVGTLFKLIFMWFGISVPLVFCGSYFAFKKPAPQDPVRTNQIPRQIPDQIWYMKPALSILMGAILPFGAVFIELYFILSAVWDNQFYYIFGFLFIVLIILVVTSAEITIVMCYFQLCAEDYHWWWRSFLTSGASALFMFLYSIFFFRRLQITKFVSVLLYFGYSLIMALAFFVMTGAIGFYSCYWFVRKIYSSIHIN